MMLTLSLSLLVLLAGYSAAHGFIDQAIIDGTAYAGNIPGKYEGASPIRMISTIDPVKGANNSNLNCGQDAQRAEIVAPANPGSNVTIQWTGGADGGSNWPHEVGPLMTYMASCGTTSCAEFNGSTANWFKIDELGQLSNGSSDWYQKYIMNGDSYTITLPPNIVPGGYLIRHEIISLQLAASMGGAEFYPACIQVQISGSGTDMPTDTVTFPGGYSDSNPGIFTPNVYNPGFDYVFPGPPISDLAAPGDGAITSHLSGTATFPSGAASVSGSGATGSGVAFPTGTGSASTGPLEPATTESGVPVSASGGSKTCQVKKSTPTVESRGLSRRHGIMRPWRRSSH